MRVVGSASLLILLGLVTSASATGCSSPAEEEADAQGADLTNLATRTTEDPAVALFDRDDQNGLQPPACGGALISAKFAVTAKSCAKLGMLVGRLADRSGHGTRARVVKVELPPEPDAEIAVVELDTQLSDERGARALITHAPLREGYTVSSIATPTQPGQQMGQMGVGRAGSIKARLVSEGASQSLLQPEGQSEICSTDIGAPVCSTNTVTAQGKALRNACGLAGLVIAQPDAEPAPPVPQGQTAPPAPPVLGPTGCSPKAWKVATLGKHELFLRRFAPEAFLPIPAEEVDDFGDFLGSLLGANDEGFLPEGLWGFETDGRIRSCRIETTTLGQGEANKETPKLIARVEFSNMQRRAVPAGRWGIAPKANPTAMRWLPARATNAPKMESFTTTFEGTVNASLNGEYVVGFRASANGGEEWTLCDIDGAQNGFTPEQLVKFRVGAPDADKPVDPTKPDATEEPTTAPSSTDNDDIFTNDPSSPESDETTTNGDDPTSGTDLPVKKKKKAAQGGCSAAPASGGAGHLPLLGVLLGLAAFVRRRRS